MSDSYNLDFIVECVKNIVDCNRCAICDKSDGSRLRYPCGHTACGDCVAGASGCLFCLTPPFTSNLTPVPDDAFTQRAKNAAAQLTLCQDAFNIDVYKRQRLSEQLKVEKELFPQCIQAPIKYSNKRKSLNTTLKLRKENRHSYYLGEQISPHKGTKMDKSNYIQKWLEQNENTILKSPPRRPFTNLDVNQQSSPIVRNNRIKKRADIMIEKAHENSIEEFKSKTRRTNKRSHFKTYLSKVENQSHLEQYMKPVENKDSHAMRNIKYKVDQNEKKNIINQNMKDESGIVADIDLIVIEDSQSQMVDKDKQALLAVIEAEKNQPDCSPPVRLECSEIVKYTDDVEGTLQKSFELASRDATVHRVPFYKRSNLSDTCKWCDNRSTTNQTAGQSKDVSITIESSDFITTIKVSNSAHNITRISTDKHSIPIQTEINGLVDLNSDVSIRKPDKVKHELKDETGMIEVVRSQDLFTDDVKTLQEQKLKSMACLPDIKVQIKHVETGVIVSDSDSDNEVNLSSTTKVIADVHRSSDQQDYGVLAEIEQEERHPKVRRGKRGLTPNSTDSSEKENYDPNRTKRMKSGKKATQKKNRKRLLLSRI